VVAQVAQADAVLAQLAREAVQADVPPDVWELERAS
jgi:hypothetical protein